MSRSAAAALPTGPPLLVIEPRSTLVSLRDLWEFRELFYFLVWRDIKVRYKQSVFGAAWAVLQPLALMLVFTVVFGRMAGVASEGGAYPVFSYAGLLPWTFFATGVAQGAGSLVTSANMISKVYFPRLIVPTAKVLQGLVDGAISLLVFALLMALYRVSPTPKLALLPLWALLALTAALGVTLWLSALNVRYRDVKQVTPFLVQIWLFVTPVIYPTSEATAVLERHGVPGWLYGLNPMAGTIEGFRWSLLGHSTPQTSVIAASAVTALVLLLTGAAYFRRVERGFADVL